MSAALAAECAGDQDKYFEMHDALFANQAELSDEKVDEIAEEIGLDMETFNACIENKDHEEEINKDLEDGIKLGVEGTPGIFVNGWLVRGAQPFEMFEELIEQELAK
jgi:protein-disulfide isomerase